MAYVKYINSSISVNSEVRGKDAAFISWYWMFLIHTV